MAGETETTGAASREPRAGAARSAKAPRERLDVLLVARGLAPTRERARALILAGVVRVDGRMVDKAGTLVRAGAACEVVGPAEELRFVSRGGLKLEHALDTFGLNPAGCVCLDVGASTGGFTDVLLRRGAARVYAVDVGHGQLAWPLRTDSRVVVMERTNIRALTSLPEPMQCAVCDVSFISLRLALPRIAALLAPGGWLVALVKPQFEAGRAEADRGGGVIADPAVHSRVLRELAAWLARWNEHSPDVQPLIPFGLTGSPILGREGNREYLLALRAGEMGPSGPANHAPAFQGREGGALTAFQGREGEPPLGGGDGGPPLALDPATIETVVASAFARVRGQATTT